MKYISIAEKKRHPLKTGIKNKGSPPAYLKILYICKKNFK